MDIEFLGNCRGKPQGYTGSVYGRGGCSPTILARDYKDPVLILEVMDGTRKPSRENQYIRKP